MSFLRRVDRHLRRWVSAVIFELRRTRRVIVSPDERPKGEPPIFIIGVHRSGTTLLRLVLDSHSRIACPPESFFIGPLAEVLKDELAMSGLTAMGFDERHVLRRLRETASYFFEMYAAAKNKPRWADKTPPYVDCLEFIDALYGPDCRYLFLYRHGLDAACSIAGMYIREAQPHIEACGGDRFAGAARYWAVQSQKMIAFRATHPSRCLEIRYEDLTARPEPELRRIFEFLSEPWEPEVLRFHERPHDHWIGLQDSSAAASRGFTPRTDRWREQPPEIIERMLQEAGTVLRELGYSADGQEHRQ